MGGLFSAPSAPAPAPIPVVEETPRPENRQEQEAAAASRARRLSARPLLSGTPLGVQGGAEQAGLNTTLGTRR
jgi:hypothetical protein